ncbi:MAG TPA: hypothetical protein VM536_22190 [Chloroflexia bacterium]|nr:hypothetical protein [Chloroflexia bacterium]
MTAISNTAGRSTELTTLSLLKNPLATAVTKALIDRGSTLTAHILEDIETIHYACWIVIDHGPRSYLMFLSNFTGSFQKYIDDFASVIALAVGLDVIWGQVVGWPGIDSVEDLKEFIRDTSLRADLYYCAYPEATVRDVLKGLKATPVVEEFFALA